MSWSVTAAGSHREVACFGESAHLLITALVQVGVGLGDRVQFVGRHPHVAEPAREDVARGTGCLAGPSGGPGLEAA